MDCIYIGKGNGDRYYKIGRTSSINNSRLKQHRTANPTFEYHEVIDTQFAREVEKRLHNYFSSKRITGTKEWFDLTPNELSSIRLLVPVYENELIPSLEQVQEFAGTVSLGSKLEANGSILDDYHRLRELREQRARIEQEEELIECRLKLQIGLHDGIEGLVSWKSMEQNRFDSRLFGLEHPALYEEFRRPLIRRYFKLL